MTTAYGKAPLGRATKKGHITGSNARPRYDDQRELPKPRLTASQVAALFRHVTHDPNRLAMVLPLLEGEDEYTKTRLRSELVRAAGAQR